MKAMSQVENEFAGNGEVRGEILFLPPAQALQMVRRCRELGLRVLGIDGFELSEKTTRPLMEHSIDLSSPPRTDPWGEAEAFLDRRLSSDLMFDIVVDE